MYLSILIPTYNRATYLEKNLELLKNYINRLDLSDQIEVVISNNNSQDHTREILDDFTDINKGLQLQVFHQKENMGLEENALFVLNKALGEYVMFLGDDDFIEDKYLSEAIAHIEDNPTTHVITPSFFLIDINGERIGTGRDEKSKNKLNKCGYLNCFINSWRGHQLSGLILKRENLIQKYEEFQVSNIYPFIFFVGYSCLTGDCYRLTSYPVKVTKPGQNNKDWTYGKDGLLNEVFDNYRKLPLNLWQKTLLQLKFIAKQPRRLSVYESKGFKTYTQAFYNIWFSNNSTILFRLIFPIEMLFIILAQKLSAIFDR